jgi:23S rRNA maturation mini-RNase III
MFPSSPIFLVCGNADEGGAIWLYYEICLQRIYMKQITTENIHKGATQEWRSHQQAQRLNHYLEIVHNVSRNMDRFTIWSHCYIQTRQISQDMDNFILSILLKQQQNNLKINQTKGALPK